MSTAQVWWPSPRSSDGRQRAVLVSATAQELLALDTGLALRLSTGPPEDRADAAIGAPQVISVDMAEYVFDFRPPAHGTRTVFNVRNAGREDHVFGLYALPADSAPVG
ncbi:MAG: hypothetical protein ACRD0Q_02885, partial [Acidimicrobiales bacterium]